MGSIIFNIVVTSKVVLKITMKVLIAAAVLACVALVYAEHCNMVSDCMSFNCTDPLVMICEHGVCTCEDPSMTQAPHVHHECMSDAECQVHHEHGHVCHAPGMMICDMTHANHFKCHCQHH